MPRAARLDGDAPEFLLCKLFLDIQGFSAWNVHNMNVHVMNIAGPSYEDFGQKRIFSSRMA